MDELVERVADIIAPYTKPTIHSGPLRRERWKQAVERAQAIIPIVQADQRERDAAIADVEAQSCEMFTRGMGTNAYMRHYVADAPC